MSARHQIVVLLENATRGRTLVELFADPHVRALRAASPEELRKLLNSQRVDAVIVENSQPGEQTGLQLVEQLFAELLRPHAFLVGSMTPAEQDRARSRGIRTVLSLEPLEQMRDTVLSLVRSSPLRSVYIPEPARRLVWKSDDVRPLPQLIGKLIGYLNDDQATVVELARDIAIDPTLTALLLKLTNSTAMGVSKKVGNILDAVKLLGIRRTVAVVLSDGLIRSQTTSFQSLSLEFRRWFHRRSILSACATSVFASRMHGLCPETGYLLGLFQDLGLLAMAQFVGEPYRATIERFRAVGQIRLPVVEQQFGMSHADVSAALMQKWQLPPQLISLVAAHHDVTRLPDPPASDEQYLNAMQAAEAFADLGDAPVPFRYHILQRHLDRFGPHGFPICRSCLDLAVKRARESSELLNVPLPDEAQLGRLIAQLAEVDRAGAKPRDGKAGSELDAASPPIAPMEGPLRILMVDDEVVLIKFVKLLLSKHGVEVLAAQSLQEARSLAPQVQAVLCDVHLGDENGIDIVRQLTADGFNGPILMVSSDATRTTVLNSIGAGIVDYLVKPIKEGPLLEKLHKHLGPLMPAARQPVGAGC